ncbi:prophage tail fiber N-terminal domain-containing protein [Orbaceae bacterium ac157xtp]
MIKLSGILKDGAGNALSSCTIELIAINNSLSVISQSTVEVVTDVNGFYDIDVLPCNYTVYITKLSRYRIGTISVYEDFKNGTLNEYLVAPCANELTPAVINTLNKIKRECESFANKAEEALNKFTDLKPVRSINSEKPDETGNINIAPNDGKVYGFINNKPIEIQNAQFIDIVNDEQPEKPDEDVVLIWNEDFMKTLTKGTHIFRCERGKSVIFYYPEQVGYGEAKWNKMTVVDSNPLIIDISFNSYIDYPENSEYGGTVNGTLIPYFGSQLPIQFGWQLTKWSDSNVEISTTFNGQQTKLTKLFDYLSNDLNDKSELFNKNPLVDDIDLDCYLHEPEIRALQEKYGEFIFRDSYTEPCFMVAERYSAIAISSYKGGQPRIGGFYSGLESHGAYQGSIRKFFVAGEYQAPLISKGVYELALNGDVPYNIVAITCPDDKSFPVTSDNQYTKIGFKCRAVNKDGTEIDLKAIAQRVLDESIAKNGYVKVEIPICFTLAVYAYVSQKFGHQYPLNNLETDVELPAL